MQSSKTRKTWVVTLLEKLFILFAKKFENLMRYLCFTLILKNIVIERKQCNMYVIFVSFEIVGCKMSNCSRLLLKHLPIQIIVDVSSF